ncbi:MAG: hypothetical protein P1U53_17810, partial [Sulfitobacter sp.]|nr:hypothetical protein [Sulfitobacter sp.]
LAECLVLVLYLVGFRYLASTLVLPLQMVLESSTAIARLVFGIAWFTWAARDFFGVGWWSAAWRVIVAFIVHMLSTVIFFASIALPWVLLN